MRSKRVIIFLLIQFVSLFPLVAAEYFDGSIRLVLNEKSGRFSLYSTGEGGHEKPVALFSDEDPRTSFLSVLVNDRSFKLGDSSSFKTRLSGDVVNPLLVFESSFLLVTQKFEFIRTRNSPETNGIRIIITLENLGDRQLSVGARYLLDTYLGERSSAFPIVTDRNIIKSETLFTGANTDSYWTDRNDKISLTGSINTGFPEGPDSVHIANWKKLNDVSWKAVFQSGRNFNFPPYSTGDTAVCYYFEPQPLDRAEIRSFELTLALSDDPVYVPETILAGISGNSVSPGTAADMLSPQSEPMDLQGNSVSDEEEEDLAFLRELMFKIDVLASSGNASEDEISALEFEIDKLRVKYSNENNLR